MIRKDDFKRIQIPGEMYSWLQAHGDPDEQTIESITHCVDIYQRMMKDNE